MAKLSISKAWDESVAFLGREMRLVIPVALATFVAIPTVSGWMEPLAYVSVPLRNVNDPSAATSTRAFAAFDVIRTDSGRSGSDAPSRRLYAASAGSVPTVMGMFA